MEYTLLDGAVALATMCAAVSSAFAAFIAYKLAKAQSYPDVIVYSDQDPERRQLVNLVIQNTGRAPAYNVRFYLSRPIPDKAFSNFIEGSEPAIEMKGGPLFHGITFLPPGGRRVITWGTYLGLKKALGDSEISIRAEYYPKESLWGVIPLLKNTSYIELNSHEGIDASAIGTVKGVIEALDRIKAVLLAK